jgi:hypothetical protein
MDAAIAVREGGRARGAREAAGSEGGGEEREGGVRLKLGMDRRGERGGSEAWWERQLE